MTLLESILVTLPLSPQPADDNLKKISDALELAITLHIRTAFVPVGFGTTFVQTAPQNPFILSLGQYLESTISPFISTAATAQATIGQLPAWASVIPGITALQSLAPPFMPGIFGVQFWTAILITIIASLPPPPPEEIPGNSESEGEGSTEVLRIDT